ncbi:hypothetical protein GCM10025865_27150 [Paraoerskovia sediminicola]|uniref:Pyruvate phosphate dikinase AMP/ATP-binding domain-containing protein n=1 Tax=Paraoerskovia sediminicola TaxID=1138587 RepID=A0ABM8G5U9_9CELL|nr:hypothetical protein GCM10025865_27150 [Paraoerskovia sediminicola]
MPRYVYRFADGDKDQKDLLGGKGANLAEMTRLGLPVPPGFTITTEACRAYMRDGHVPAELRVEVTLGLREIEDEIGRRLGDFHEPLLVSVRSGARHSMPGMMDTVLNIGLNDASVKGLTEFSGDERFAWDSYRRLIQMFGKTVLGVDGELFAGALDDKVRSAGVAADAELLPGDLRDLVETFKQIVRDETGREFPQHPREQLDMAVEAVLDSWNTDRARLYRRRERIPNDLGTAVNVVSMVFGNLGESSGTGVCFTRDPSSGQSGVYGDYLSNAQGRTSSRGSATPSRSRSSSCSTPSRTASSRARCAASRPTTATCATSSSRSSAASCGCCRPGSASGRRPRPSASPPSSSTSRSSPWTRRSPGARATSSPSCCSRSSTARPSARR